MSLKLSDFIIQKEGILKEEFCKKVIDKFEKDDRKHDGHIGSGQNQNSNVKKSTDLLISELPDWESLDSYVHRIMTSEIKDYLDFFMDSTQNKQRSDIIDTGYQIQRTKKGEYYTWHTDDQYAVIADTYERETKSADYERRLFTYILYLNQGFEGGSTEIVCGPSEDDIIEVVPKTGKLLFFPANNLYVHRGVEVTKGTKYLMTGWVCDYTDASVYDGM